MPRRSIARNISIRQNADATLKALRDAKMDRDIAESWENDVWLVYDGDDPSDTEHRDDAKKDLADCKSKVDELEGPLFLLFEEDRRS